MWKPGAALCLRLMQHLAMPQWLSRTAARSNMIDDEDIVDLVMDHARIRKICEALTVIVADFVVGKPCEIRTFIAHELESAFDRRVRLADDVLHTLFGGSPAACEDSILAVILRRQIRDALDAQELGNLLRLDPDAVALRELHRLVSDLQENARHTLHLEALSLLTLLDERLTGRARQSLRGLLHHGAESGLA